MYAAAPVNIDACGLYLRADAAMLTRLLRACAKALVLSKRHQRVVAARQFRACVVHVTRAVVKGVFKTRRRRREQPKRVTSAASANAAVFFLR